MKKIILFIMLIIFAQAADITGREVVNKMLSSDLSPTMQMNIKLKHVDIKRGIERKKIRELIRYTKRYDSGNYKSKSLLRFIKPDIMKGTGFLIWAKSAGGNEQWLFLPKLKTAKQIESKEKTQQFMNTEFSYEDLESFNQSDEQYFYKGEEKVDGISCHKVEVIGHTQTQYKRRMIWIDKQDWLLRKVEFYDKSNKLFKVLSISSYKTIGMNKFATNLKMENIQTGSYTVMDISNIKFNIEIPDSYFTKKSLVNP